MSERPRASAARASMLRGMTVPPRPVPQPVPSDDDAAVPDAAAPQPAARKPAKRGVPDGTTKYSANLDADTAAEFDSLALIARRKLGRRVEKVEIMKALIRLAADDASLRDQVISEVEKAGR
jgi:hypothetical protein